MTRAYAGGMGTNPGVLRRAVTRLASSAKEHEAQELLKDCVEMGAVPVSELPDRELVRVAGTLRTVTLRPRAGVPALVAELYDGSGVLTVVWLGRRNIEGIEAGKMIRVHGRVAQRDGQAVVFNPSYELLSGGGVE